MFRRPTYDREAEKAANLVALCSATVKPVVSGVYAPVGVSAARPKQNAIEHEGYRRLVAAMPCKACGIEGYSQAAHVPPDGRGIKQDDREIFALCCTRSGINGCSSAGLS